MEAPQIIEAATYKNREKRENRVCFSNQNPRDFNRDVLKSANLVCNQIIYNLLKSTTKQ